MSIHRFICGEGDTCGSVRALYTYVRVQSHSPRPEPQRWLLSVLYRVLDRFWPRHESEFGVQYLLYVQQQSMGNSASSLPYAIGKKVAFVNDGWDLHEGHRKSDGERVSVFMAKKPSLQKNPVNPRQPNMSQYETALHHFQNCKKLRHPHILQIHATLDTDHPNADGAASSTAVGNPANATASNTGDLIVVTEPCVALDTWLNSRPPPEQIAWGLEAIVRALHFLHASAGLCHGNLSPGSFYVTPAGDVKLWNFSLACSWSNGGMPRHFIDWEGLVTPQPYRSPERIEGRWDAISASGVHCLDSYGLGVLISHLFGGTIPPPLTKAVQRLQTANPKMRPRLQPLLKCPVFDTPYQKLQLQLEEFAVQPAEQKIQFWQNLTPNLQAELVPEQLAVHKLLPLIKSGVETICLNESMRAEEVYRREGVCLGMCGLVCVDFLCWWAMSCESYSWSLWSHEAYRSHFLAPLLVTKKFYRC